MGQAITAAIDKYSLRLFIALLVSFLLHWILLGNTHISIPTPTHHQTMQVTIQQAENDENNLNLAQPAREDTMPDAAQITSARPIADESLSKQKNPPVSTASTELSKKAETDTPVSEKYEPMPLLTETNPANNVDIQYEIYSSQDISRIAKATHHFELKENNIYSIKIRPQGEYKQDSPDYFIEIQGRIFRKSLGSSNYLMKGELANQLMALNDISSNALPHASKIPDNLMDAQSLVYYFMFFPPSNTHDQLLLLSDGQKFGSYSIQTLGMSITQNSSIGALRSVKVKLMNQENPEYFEFWLSPDYKYLPLKITHTDIHGNTITMMATSINTDN